MHTVLRSATREVVIGDDQPFCLMGERINPTGRKIFAEALRKGDLSRIAIDVEQQVAGGATMLDVNMGVPLADEAELLAQAVTMIQGLTDLPLVIDPSAMPIGADTTLVVKTLKTIELIHDELGLNMTLGASNVSFGMPGRHALGATFLPMAMKCGLTSAIMDVRAPQIVEAVKAADL